MQPCKIHLIAGTRPNVMKIAPLHMALSQQSWCSSQIVFLEQHNSANMGIDVFRQLGIDGAITQLPLKGDDFGSRLGDIISAYSAEIARTEPDLIVVPGDVDVSLGAAIAGKRGMRPVAHLEAGLRSNDMRMPEELNRVMIDGIADILLAPSEAAAENLIYGDGHPRTKVHFVGNIMIDSLVRVLCAETASSVTAELGVYPKEFGVVTFHRPANVDNVHSLARLIDLMLELSHDRPIVFPVHPRTSQRMTAEQGERLTASGKIILTGPMGYSKFINLVSQASFVVTDSGGIQEETSFLRVPCLTLRETTERPITTISGTNVLVSFDDAAVHAARIEKRIWPREAIPLWDGETAYRCAHVLNTWWRQNRG